MSRFPNGRIKNDVLIYEKVHSSCKVKDTSSIYVDFTFVVTLHITQLFEKSVDHINLIMRSKTNGNKDGQT